MSNNLAPKGSSHSKSKSISSVLGGLFGHKSKDSKGGSKDKDKKNTTPAPTTTTSPSTPTPAPSSNPEPSETTRGRSDSSTTKTTTPTAETHEGNTGRVETPTHNGKASHNDIDSNTSGEANHDIPATRQQTPTQSEAIDHKETPSNNRPPTPPEDIAQKQRHLVPSPVDKHQSQETPSNPSVDRTKQIELSGSGSPLLSHPQTLKKKSSGFTPLPFEEKQGPKADTPNARQRTSGPPEILPEEITYEESDLVGHGSFGSVYKGRCRGQEVAVKVPKKQKLTMAELTSFRNEVKVMSVIYHPHVVLFLGACTQLGKMQIITERCMTDLEKLLANDREKKHFTLAHRMQMAKDAALGVHWLHSKCNIVHLDLKSANLLLDHNMRVKVTDFGFATIKDSLAADKAKKGTPLWMAPEVMMGNKYDEKADVYSFGIILWEILTREIPYAHHNDYQTFFRAVCIDKERPPIPPNTLPSLEHLITSCWDFNPQKRPSFEEIIFRLNEVLVDCSLENEQARDLWKQNFLLPKQELVEQVPWAEYEAVIKKSVGKNVNLEALRPYLVCAARDPILKGKEVVTPERFDKLIKWFGLFFDAEEGPAIFDEVNELLTKPWFHGDISKEAAMDRLATHAQTPDDGTYLIRLSSTDPKVSPFTLSMSNNQHRRIRRLNVEEDGAKGYNIQGKATVYNSLVELAEKCVDYNLKTPCPKQDRNGYNPYDPYREVVLSHS